MHSKHKEKQFSLACRSLGQCGETLASQSSSGITEGSNRNTLILEYFAINSLAKQVLVRISQGKWESAGNFAQ